MTEYSLTDRLIALSDGANAKRALFTGCSLADAGENFSRHLYEFLSTRGIIDCAITVCCGKMLPYIGEPIAPKLYTERLTQALCESGLEQIVVACPSCYYTLKSLLETTNTDTCPTVLALPAALHAKRCSLKNSVPSNLQPITIHDSCPDKEGGTFAVATRSLFEETQLCEMAHCKDSGICCSYNPELETADDIELASSRARMLEAYGADAKTVVTYCMRCARVLSHVGQDMGQIEAHHYLEFLLSETVIWNDKQGEADCTLLY